MYDIEFYEDESGYSEISEYIKNLQKKSIGSKESRIQFNKIVASKAKIEKLAGKGEWKW